MTGDRVTVVLDWSTGILNEGNAAFRKSAPQRAKWVMIGTYAVIMFFAFVFGDKIALAVFGNQGWETGSYETGFSHGVIVFVGALVLAVFFLPIANRMAIKDFYQDTPYFSRPWTIEVSVQGIVSRGPYNAGTIDWPAIISVVQGKNAIVLSLGGGGFIPLPHAGLPEDVTPDEMVRRIEAWRGAGDF